jgi:S-adenosylmethionine hydrolase
MGRASGSTITRPSTRDVRRRPPGALLLYQDAYRTLALAINRGSARDALGLELDATVRIVPA